MPDNVKTATPLDESKWIQALRDKGYSQVCGRAGRTCAIYRFNYTTGLLVGLDPVGYERRYCYEHAQDADRALADWDGHGHPGGPWIKCKGAGIDLLNPAFG
jgi:hypothetical protein